LQVRRFRDAGTICADVIYCEDLGCPETPSAVPLDDPLASIDPPASASASELLRPLFASGARVNAAESIGDSRARATAELASLDARSKRLLFPQTVPVGLERGLNERKQSLIRAARGGVS